MISCTESHQVRIICRCWNGNTSGTSSIRVTQLIGQGLKFISIKTIVIPEYMVMGRSTGPLWKENTLVTELSGIYTHLAKEYYVSICVVLNDINTIYGQIRHMVFDSIKSTIFALEVWKIYPESRWRFYFLTKFCKLKFGHVHNALK